MRISRPKLIIALLFLGLVVLVRHAMRDINLDVDLLRESLTNMPGLVMENIQMSRVISGDTWRVRVPMLAQEGEAIIVRSIDVRREISGDKGEWYFFGRYGTYSNDEKAASINWFLGTINDGRRVWNVESPRLTWKQERNTLTFPDGLTVYDHEFLLKAPIASTDNSGVVLLQQGGIIRWVKPLE